MAAWLVFEANMLQATEKFPQSQTARKMDKNTSVWSPDVCVEAERVEGNYVWKFLRCYKTKSDTGITYFLP